MAILSNLLHSFYRFDLPYLPFAEALEDPAKKRQAIGPPGALLGFISLRSLQRWSSDLQRFRKEYKEIPAELIDKFVCAREMLDIFSAQKEIPVLGKQGHLLGYWNEKQLLFALGGLASPAETKEEQASRETFAAAQSDERWLGEFLLKAMPLPLYACNLRGRTLFFNGLFERDILPKKALKASIRHAESYLLRILQELLAQSFSRTERKEKKFLENYDPKLEALIRISNLEEKGKIFGYLFCFDDKSSSTISAAFLHRLEQGSSLAALLTEVEANIITESLNQKRYNISHTAKALQMKRSTLQHKIQRLQIPAAPQEAARRKGRVQAKPAAQGKKKLKLRSKKKNILAS